LNKRRQRGGTGYDRGDRVILALAQAENSMRLHILPLSLVVFSSVASHAQTATKVPPASQQIASAVLALPPELRDSAAVLGYSTDGKFVQLREGKNEMICLASDPALADFHVSCYHRSMEPFMARGRELRAQGVKGPRVDTVRFAEVKSGKIKMPTQPAVLYQIFAKPGAYDPATNRVSGGTSLYVVYMPFATAASTGLSPKPQAGTPWIMFPGTPKAHIMFTPSM